MGIINPTLPSVNSPRGDEEIDARNALATVLGEFNGNVDQNNLKDGAVTKAKLATDSLNAFMKLNSAADRKITWGAATTVGSGFSNASSGAIAHGLGVAPVFAIACSRGHNWVANVQGWDATNLTIGVQTIDNSMSLDWGTGFGVLWLAIA